MKMAELDALLHTYGVTKKTLEHAVSVGHRNEIAKRIGGDWESLATFIGVPPGDIDDIRDVYRKPLDKRLAMMRRWHELWGSEATYLTLLEGLRQIGRRDLIENVLIESKFRFSSLAKKPSPKYILLVAVGIAIFFGTGGVFKSRHYDSVSQYHNTTSIEQNLTDSTSFHLQTTFDNKVLRNCSNSLESDLPKIHPLFVGRENDVHQVLLRVARAHIVNINGAPGFGKSTLAIHIGYEILKNGTSVRYINIEDNLFFLVNQQNEPHNMTMPDGSSNANVPQATHKSSKLKSLVELSRSSLSASRSPTLSNQYQNFFDELKRWSEALKCTSVLILDNCDDILTSKLRQKFLRIINILVIQSNFKLHIVLVSRERVLFLDSFDSWTVRELNQSASVQLLDKLAPAIDNKSLMAVAELVEGCPLALKVIGRLLHIRGVQLIHKIKKELITMLDEVSDQEQRFRVIMDVAFNRLGVLKDCGYVLSLFPGSFDEQAGTAIIQKECLKTYLKHSLLNEYSLAFNYRYKMHRLIKEYLQEKISIGDNTTFITKFRKYFEALLLAYVIRQEIIDESDAQKYTLSLELHNLHLLKELLLTDLHLSSEELTILAFLSVSEMKLTQPEQLHRYYEFYMQNIHEVCPLLNPKLCGQLYTIIVKYLYQQCKCETLTAYIHNFIVSPCMNHFQCQVVNYFQDLYTSGVLHLSEDESSYIHLVVGLHCNGGFYTTRNLFTDNLKFYVNTAFGICSVLVSSFLTAYTYTNCYCRILNILVGLFIISVIMLIILCGSYSLIIEPAFLIYELDVKTARHIRFLEIISKSVCQFVIFFITITFILTSILLRLPQHLISINTDNQWLCLFCVFLSVFFIQSFIGYLSIQHYCCRFIPLCV